MTKLIHAFVTGSVLALIPTSNAYAQRSNDDDIEWRVQDRFRLFAEASPEAKQQAEMLMASIANAPDRPLSDYYDQYLSLLVNAENPERARSLRRSYYLSANEQPGRDTGRYVDHYNYPVTYRIQARWTKRRGHNCLYETITGPVAAACDQWVTLNIPAGKNDGNSVGAEGGISITVDTGEQAQLAYSFDDELIIALGDSFISGEGNPDLPSRIDLDGPPKIFKRPSWTGKLSAGKHIGQEAEWWDEPCHRSLLSWPVLASIAYAARDEKRAVTFIHLGCSGAVVDDLIKSGQTKMPGGGDANSTQLDALERLMEPPTSRRKRNVNAMFLSIGGNDIGFVGVLTTLTLPPNGYTLGRLGTSLVGTMGDAQCPYRNTGRPLSTLCGPPSAETLIEDLPTGYSNLRKRLLDLGVQPRDVFHAAYPNPLVCGDRACDNNPENGPGPERDRPAHSGFEALMGKVKKVGRGIFYRTWNFELRYDAEENVTSPIYPQLPNIECDIIAEPSDSEVCQAILVHHWLNAQVRESGFTTIDAHLDAIRGHGLTMYSDVNDLSLPTVDRKRRWRTQKTPINFNPYARDEAGRWFRLPNDSVLTQYHFHGQERHFHEGTVHPTYRAHLEYAEAALRQALLSGD